MVAFSGAEVQAPTLGLTVSETQGISTGDLHQSSPGHTDGKGKARTLKTNGGGCPKTQGGEGAWKEG